MVVSGEGNTVHLGCKRHRNDAVGGKEAADGGPLEDAFPLVCKLRGKRGGDRKGVDSGE